MFVFLYECTLFFRTFKKKIENTAYVHVFFRDIGVTKFNKDQLFGWQDIVGICKLKLTNHEIKNPKF